MHKPNNPPLDSWATGEPEPRSPVSTLPYHPERIGRYRIEKVLGEGGFGRVYLAHDEQIHRRVAIKVPRPDRLSRPEDAEEYLAEARVVASLDHPNIVPVYDVGSTEDGMCYVVSKFIEGCDLAQKMRQTRLSFQESVELVAIVAEALHYAHRKKLVHRDIKPANLLIDTDGKPFVADFGLALQEQDFGRGSGFAGTPSYMSPEQARGEGHRVDGRSDIFSLGVIFYELLTGRRPFGGEDMSELLEQIKKVEARPPRQVDDTIPKELERICLKAISKRASERYTTARDMAEDLRHFQPQAVQQENIAAQPSVPVPAAPAPGPLPTPTPSLPVTPSSDQRPIKIVPKGLRSFDAHDADFFLELLPGPRDRDGLPDSLRFWKTRIEEMDPDNTFSVGLVYGPSGCGKSSLVKAGLLPRLSGSVLPIYVEATGDETEARLLKGLRKQCPDLPAQLSLIETLTALRRERFLPPGKKVLLVLDQFEQWLHARKEETNTELVQALRQCDGRHVQCVVMVRDDFWLAVSRFLRDLEIRLIEGQNSALADLFDADHARKVLAAFGRAFGKLPEKPGETSKEQQEFVNQAIQGLSQENKVISVRLALFAEMMKGKPWTPAILKDVGGAAGVGVTFLEETFSASTAPPDHRYHQKAARAVLQSLLPESGTDIKGHMRSHADLLAASGYSNRPKDFDELVRILDSEIRLITPTDPEGKDPGEPGGVSPRVFGEKYFQLTHDYLVPSLRDWLTRKQKETRRGRAELLLADRASVWNTCRENRQLPSLLQWLQIRWLTAKKNWTLPQRKMMGQAGRYHVLRGLLVFALVTLLGCAGYEAHGRIQAHALRRSLLDANTNEVPSLVADMAPYRRWIDPLLRDAAAQAESAKEPRKQLHASLALLPVDPTEVTYLVDRLLDAAPHEVGVIRDALAPHKDGLLERLWTVVDKPNQGKEAQRLRAATALALYDPDNERWTKASPPVVKNLVLENPVFLGQWSEAFRPIKNKLLAPLSEIYQDHQPESTAERSLATSLLADYAADQPQVLADLLMNADEKQFAVIYPKFKEQGERGVAFVNAEIDKKLPPDLPSSDKRRETLAKRQANAAVALLQMDQPGKVWPLFQHSSDPRVRSYLIHRLSPLGADPGAISKRYDEEPNLTSRRALLLSLGEFNDKGLVTEARQALLPKVKDIYQKDNDPGLHAASEWLLRSWQQDVWLKQVNEEWKNDGEQRKKRLESIGKALAKDKEKTPLQWYVNTEGQTFVVIPGPVEFLMGSPKTEQDHGNDEVQHQRRIGRTIAIASKSVTLAQYRSLTKDKYEIGEKYTRHPDLPVVGINWYMAAQYCNLLSKKEGIDKDQWCYETDAKGAVTKLKKDYLSLTGYRLPTEAEMEYATRAGAKTSRYYGETEELLGNYAWYDKNSNSLVQQVGTKKPNDFGLFDMQGNCYTWCQEPYDNYSDVQNDNAVDDKEAGQLVIISTDSRVLRGGSFYYRMSNVRSAIRNNYVPTYRDDYSGFRLARTFTP